MKHLLKKLTLLALALAMGLGAWAQGAPETITVTGQYNSGTNATVMASFFYGGGAWVDNGNSGTTISTDDGSYIGQLVLTVNMGMENSGNAQATSGTCSVSNEGHTITVTDINAPSVTISNPTINPFVISMIEVTFVPVPAGTVTRTAEGNWTFVMPAGNRILNVIYKADPQLAYLYDGQPMPAQGITAYYGFHQETMQKVSFSMGNDFLTYVTGLSSAEQTALLSLLVDSSSNPAVVAIGLQGPEVVGPGECDIYSIFRGNDDYRADTAAFHITILNPATLTLEANPANGGTVAPVKSIPLMPISVPDGWMMDNTTITAEGLPGFAAVSAEEAMTITNPDPTATATRVIYAFGDYNSAQYIDFTSEGRSSSSLTLDRDNLFSLSTMGFRVYYTIPQPDSIVATATEGQYLVVPGASVQVVATATDGNHVSSWSNQDPVTNYLSDTATLTVGETMTLTATFAQNPLLTLTANQGGTVTLDGASVGPETLLTTITLTSATPNYSVADMVTLDKGSASYKSTQSCWICNGETFMTVSSAVDSIVITRVKFTTNAGDSWFDTVAPFRVKLRQWYVYTDDMQKKNGEGITGIEVYGATVTTPAGITADGSNYRVLPGTSVSVTATPDATHYLATLDSNGTAQTLNSNTAVTKAFAMPTEAVTMGANFAAKPVLTLAQNESWGSVSVSGPVVWNNQIWGSWNMISTSFPQTIGDITINKNNFYCYYESGKLLLHRSVDNNSFVTFTSAGDNFTRIEMTYTGGSNLEPANEWTCENGVAVWEGNAQSVTITNATNFYFTQIKFIRGSGIAQLTDTTYRVDYGTEVTLNAEATTMHHVQGWLDEDSNAMATATYSNYAIYAAPDSLFPAKSSLTFQMTGDTTVEAQFGINSYDLTAQVATTTDLRGTVSFDYTDVEGNTQAIGDTNAMTVTAQGGSQTTVTATAQTGYHFVKWQNQAGDSVSGANPLTVTEAGNYTAVFDTNVYTLTVALCDECTDEMGTVTGSGQVKHFLSYPISVVPNIAYFFTEWSNGSTEAFDTVSLVSDSTIKATLLPKKVLTFAHNEGGQMEFIVPQDVTTFEGINTTSLSQNGITVTAANADADGMYLSNGSSINISIAGTEKSITQVDFHVTNGANLVSTITVVPDATITYTANNDYGSVMGLNAGSLTISSPTTHDLQIDQLTVHYGRTLPNGVAHSAVDSIFYVMPDTTVTVRAIPDEGHYLVSWSDNAQVIDTLSASITMTQDETLTATFALNPVITLAVSDPAMGSAYFTGYHGNTVTRAGIIKAESVDLPYQWYEASEIMSIEGGNGNVTKDANSHYVIVSGVFDGTATVITSTGAFNVTCEPTLPNGVHYNIAEQNYTVMPYTELSLTATTLADNYHFVDWAKVTATDSTIFDSVAVTTITINGDMKLQANFWYNPYLLTLAADADSMGVMSVALADTGSAGHTAASGQLTVCDGTVTNSYVPAYGFYADAYLKAEMVYPASMLTDIPAGTDINQMTFYAATPATEPWTSTWQVFLSEVADETINAYAGPGTVVYEGQLDGTGSEMTINFTTPYTYNGGNLLVGVYNIATGNYKSVTWTGVTSNGSSVQGYNYNGLDGIQPTQRNFLPKVTFDYAMEAADPVPPSGSFVAGSEPNTYIVEHGSELVITATANASYHVTGWSNGAEVDSLPVATQTVTIVSDSAITATFGVNPVLTLAATTNGTVAVSGTLPEYAIDNQDGSYSVLPGTAMSLVATPDASYHVTGWSNGVEVDSLTAATQTVIVNSDTTLSATFGVNPVVTLAANGNGNVVIDSLPGYAVDNQNGTYSVLPGTVLNIVSTPDTHYYMTQWDDSDSMVNSNVAVSRTDTIYADTTISATFLHKPILTLTTLLDTTWGSVTIEGAGSSSGSGSGGPVDVTIGDSTSTTTNSYITTYSLYEYSYSQEIYTASEIGTAGTIQSLTMWLKNTSSYTRNIEIYMKEIEDSIFADNTSWVSLSDGDLVATGTIVNGVSNPIATTYTLDTPFEYSGNGNLLFCIRDVTGDWSSGVAGIVTAVDSNQAIYTYRDGTPYDISNPGVNGTLFKAKNVVKFHIATATLGNGTVVAQLTDTTYVVDYNNDVTMKTNAKTGYHFVNWQGSNNIDYGTADSLTIRMTIDTTVRAIFDTLHYNLVVNVDSASTGFGTATGSVAEARHFLTYDIEATADSGYHFVVWSDGDSTASRTVTLTSDSTFTATFDTNEYHLEVVVADTCTGRGTVTGDTIAKHFLSYEISATANPGYHFVGWSDGVTDASRTVTLTSDSTIAAIFDYNPALTLVYNEQSGHVEFIVDNQVANFTGIAGTSLTADGLTVTAESADDMGMSIKDNQTITIVADSGMIINQVAFHLTNGTNKASLINATAGTVNATNGNAYGAVTDVHNDTVVISSTSDKSINIDQLTIQYAPIMPAGVVRLESDNHDVYRVDYNTTVSLLAVPADSSYLESWAGDTASTNDLVAVVTIDSSDATVYANFSGNPILTLAANGNGRVFFNGYSGFTVNRDETVLVTNITDFPYSWYEAGEISEITGGDGMVYADQTNHYINVDGAFNGTATVVTTSGAFTVTCIPTVPNGITIISLDTFSVAPGTEVTINAEAEAEHYLVNWNDLDSAATERTVTVNYNTDLVANFLHNPYLLTVNVDTVMGSAAPAAGQTYVTLNADGTYTVMADSTVALVATPDSGYHFVNWTDANNNEVSADASIEFTMVGDTAFTANIDTNVYQLIVLAADTNMGVVAGTDSTAKHFLPYSISATPNAGFRFMSWSDGDTNASRTISLTQDSTLTATFDTIHAELAWSDTAFTGYTLIDFNAYKPTLSNPNNVEVRYGVVEDSITVNETTGMIGSALGNTHIAGKTGTFHIYAVHDLTPDYFYDSVAYTLTVEQGVVVTLTQSIEEGGTALFADRDSLPTLTHRYNTTGTLAIVAHDHTVDVVAEAAEGYHFTAWQEGDSVNGYSDIATTAEYTYTVPNAIAAGLKAVFDTNVYNMNIAVADANDGMGTVTGPATVKHFLSGTFVATAETGYHFTGWQNEAGTVVSTLDTLVVEPVSDTTLYATFDTNVYTLTVLAADSTMGSVAGSRTVKHFVECEISATPVNSCHEFVAWSDNDSTATRTVTLTSDSTITAEFAYTVRASHDTLVVCDTLIWNGNTYTVSDDYAVPQTTTAGCDSTANLHLTVKYSTNSTTTVTECESYKWHDITYTMSTLAHFDTVNAVGCDSIANLDLTIHYNTVGQETVVTCDTMYIWNGITYISSTIGTWNGTNQYGCDSTATLNLTLNNNFASTDVQQHCYSFTWIDGVTYTESTNTPTYVYQMENGCDSTVTLDLTISNVAVSIDTVTACDSYTWMDGVTYTASTNEPTFTVSSSANCDSIITLNLTINNSVEYSFDIATCSYYIWDGTYYSEAGSYSKHYTAANGCDSTATLNLTVNQAVTFDTSITACGSYVWNGVTYASSGAYNKTLQSVNNCDSIVTLTLTVNQPTTATVTVTAGSSYEWNGETYTASGNYTYTTTGSNGCDSTTTLQLTITNPVNGSETRVACGSYTWNGTEYTESGDYTYSHPDNYGNTQVDTLHLTINNSVEHSFDTAACNYFVWDGTYYDKSGSYTKHYTAVNSCDSAATLNLTINQPVTAAVSYTSCGSYTWNEMTCNTSGTYSKILPGSNGCDSTVTLTLTVNQPTSATVVASACDSYEWHGVTYTETPAEAPTYTTEGSNGCDSVTTLQLVIAHSGNSVDNVTACDSYTWIDGVTYTASTNEPTYTVTGSNCNTIMTLNLTIKESVSNSVDTTACNYYIWDGNYYNETGSYTKHYTAVNGCDSTVTLALTVNQPVTAAISHTSCGSYSWNNNNYEASGVYTYTTTGINGCDSTTTLTLTVKQPVNATVTASACESYTWNGQTYDATGNYTYTTEGSNGCDSVTTLQLTVRHATTGIETIEACDSYTWHGTVFNASNNTATYTTTNAANCDSTVTLNLTIKESVENSIDDEACNYYIWDGTYYNQSGSYTKHYTAANGCDSTVTLALTINQPVTAAISATACVSYTWNDVEYTASGAYTQTLTGSNGCDSTVTLTLTVKQPVTATVTASACESYTWNGETYTTSGNYTYTTEGSNGCDSTTTLTLTVNQPMNTYENVTVCDGYSWNGTTYTTSGIYISNFEDANNCNAVATLNLTVNNSVSQSIAATACDSYSWNGTTYTASGTYTYTTTAANSCDSTVTLYLTVNQSNSENLFADACVSYEWNGTTYQQSGVYTYTTTNAANCDSTVTLVLNILQPVTTTVNQTACDSYTWNGTTYTTSGNYTYTTTAANSCDSIVTLALTVNYSTTAIETVEACGSYEWHGVTYTSSTSTPSYTSLNVAGCDSTVTLHLTINQPVEVTLDETACDSYEWNGTTYTVSGTYTYTTTTVNNCDSTVTLNLTVNHSTYSVLNLQGEGSIEWNGETFTESGVYERTLTNEAGCDSVVTLVLAILPEGVPAPYLYNLMDVLLTINHNEEGLENVHYVWYRWYRDGELVLEGADKDSYSEGGNKLNGCYYLEVATDESMEYWVRSNEICIYNSGIAQVKDIDITLAPNPVTRGEMVSVTLDADDADLQGAQILIFDVQGRKVYEQKGMDKIVANLHSGMYMVRLTLNDGRTAVRRLIVK